MVTVTYQIVQHDGGWAYKVSDVFSETFASRDAAVAAAKDAAARQQLAGDSAGIVYEDADSHWHEEVSSGDDRPQTAVET